MRKLFLFQTRREKVLAGVSALLLFLCIVLLRSYASVQNRAESAVEQIAFFNEMSNRSLAGDPPAAAACLTAIVNHFPSGTKQSAGSALDTIVERQRERAQLEVIAMLRMRTRDDLGQRPGPWIKKYSRPSEQPRADR